MKSFVFLFLIFFASLVSYGQLRGSISVEKNKTVKRTGDIFYYNPPQHLFIPEKIYASIVYKKNGEDYYYETRPLVKIKGRYQFEYNTPDSVHVLIISLNDKRKQIFDNNNELGYIHYTKSSEAKIRAQAYIDAMDLLSYYAKMTLKLDKVKMISEMVNLYQTAYKLSPTIKNQSRYYNYYLYLLYQQNKDLNTPTLLSYANRMATAKNNEDKLLNAMYVYRTLRMNKKYEQLESKAISTYPNGRIARNKYVDSFYDGTDSTEQSLLDKKTAYTQKFNDSSAEMIYALNYNIISLLIQKKQYNKLDQYEVLIKQKLQVTNTYDFNANKLSSEPIVGNKFDLSAAKILSYKALMIMKEQIANLSADRNDGIFQNAYNRYVDTYAQILYKLKMYDSAFYYQNTITNTNSHLEPAMLEHYVLYAGKAKGEIFAFDYIKNQLQRGFTSIVLLNQLKLICKKLGVSQTVYDSLIERSYKLFQTHSLEKIKKKFGTVKSAMFSLKNLQGKTISTSLLKNKVIVLDFWATWCAPCIASFPTMQQVVNEYKNDTNVVFLFVDTWEYKEPKKMMENAKTFIKKNKYSFQVLLDEENKVVSKFKVDAIPYKFIINKRGEIVFMGDTTDIALEIENAKR